MNITLPWPPSINTYWRSVNGKMLISKKGRAYRASVINHIRPCKPTLERLSVRIICHPPDKRKRDLDNLPKGLLDALEHAGVYADDSQIDELYLRRDKIIKDGCVIVSISPFLPKQNHMIQ